MTSAFSWHSEGDSDLYRSLTGLTKKDGFFNSAKQRDYLRSGKVLRPWGPDGAFSLTDADVAFVKSNFGVDAKPGNIIFMPQATASWAYGRRAQRWVTWVFVVDEYGVVSKWKLKYHYDDSTGSSCVNEAKTVLEWSRPADAVLPVFVVEPTPAAPTSMHIGVLGKRIEVEVTVENMRSCVTSWGDSVVTTLHDCFGNILKTFTRLPDVEKGQKIKIKATIVRHDTYKGVASTIVNRVKVL